MLYSYIQTTQELMGDLKETLIPPALLTSYINKARQQIAGEAECVRVPATLSISSPTQSYNFSSISIANSGVLSTLSIRLAAIIVSSVYTFLDGRSFEWFWANYLATGTAETTGTPKRWAQQGQGSLGTIYFDPIPNASFTVSLDIVGIPKALASDSDAEALPYPWQDAVPFRAAFYGYLYAQKDDMADKMYARSMLYENMGRKASTPSVLPHNMPGFEGAVEAGKAIPVFMAGALPAQRGVP